MAASAPLSRLTLGAASVADDLGYVALSDLARVLEDVTENYRVIGGHMVTMLAARWQLGARLHRETGDVDLGVPPIVARDHDVVGRLKNLNYKQVAGNRFARGLSDIPAGMTGGNDAPSLDAFIDVLVPAYTSRARQNVPVGEDLFTTEVLGAAVRAGPPAGLAHAGTAQTQWRDIAVRAAVPRRGERTSTEKPRHKSPVQRHRHIGHLAVPGDSLCRRSRTH